MSMPMSHTEQIDGLQYWLQYPMILDDMMALTGETKRVDDEETARRQTDKIRIPHSAFRQLEVLRACYSSRDFRSAYANPLSPNRNKVFWYQLVWDLRLLPVWGMPINESSFLWL